MIGNSDPTIFEILIVMLGTFGVAIGTFQLLYRRRDLELSRYNEVRREAELSAMRASYEKNIGDLAREMVATRARWEEANHLLISGQQHQQASPSKNAIDSQSFLKSFGINPEDIEILPKQIFVLTPFAQEEKRAFEIIREVSAQVGLQAIRGDETRAEGDILQQVISGIVSSRLVIANISSRNPNVFFELGISMALGKPTLLISDTLSDVPFDVRGRRILIYKTWKELESRLQAALVQTLIGDAPE